MAVPINTQRVEIKLKPSKLNFQHHKGCRKGDGNLSLEIHPKIEVKEKVNHSEKRGRTKNQKIEEGNLKTAKEGRRGEKEGRRVGSKDQRPITLKWNKFMIT